MEVKTSRRYRSPEASHAVAQGVAVLATAPEGRQQALFFEITVPSVLGPIREPDLWRLGLGAPQALRRVLAADSADELKMWGASPTPCIAQLAHAIATLSAIEAAEAVTSGLIARASEAGVAIPPLRIGAFTQPMSGQTDLRSLPERRLVALRRALLGFASLVSLPL